MLASVLFLLFISIIFYEFISDDSKVVTKDMEVDLMVERVKKTQKGILLLQDSIAIHGETPLISPIQNMKAFANYESNLPENYVLRQVVPKFRFKKEANSDTITVYHYGDTLLFKLFLD
ncbi:hypothetical protein [Allomuricauda sp. ARW1Y1]|uniref:hypothetical protein n=1 Tax=Allomuricauda sp. ARW1Y1 TaxID=2663843 RepID=UPI0015CD6864|nr:hypothetical protein [Muricauda sp. ARW1Y1]NYJ26296.1 hypothetical protein [Muricauda sp. ARW1Y1]